MNQFWCFAFVDGVRRTGFRGPDRYQGAAPPEKLMVAGRSLQRTGV